MRKLGGALLALGFSVAPLSAATVTVNDTGDTTGACSTSGTGSCHLSAACTFAILLSGERHDSLRVRRDDRD